MSHFSKLRRLRTSVLSLAAAAAVGLSAQAHAAEKIVYMLPAPLVLPAFGPHVLAKHLGYFAEKGYDVEFQVGKGGVDVAKQIGAGNAVIGNGLGDTPIIVRANGIPVKVVSMIGNGGFAVITARGDRGIKKLEDLKGKVVTVLSYQDTTYFALLGALSKVGLTKDDVNIQAVGPSGVPNLVISGNADACACTPDWEINVKQGLNGNIITFPTLDYFPTTAQAVVTSDEVIKTKPQLVQAIVDGIAKGMAFIVADPAKAAKAYVEAMPTYAGKEELVTTIFANYNQRTYNYKGATSAKVEPARLEALQKFYLAQGFIQKETPITELYDPKFVK
jgi:NitT/TauT family transport system substrate-binding protein